MRIVDLAFADREIIIGRPAPLHPDSSLGDASLLSHICPVSLKNHAIPAANR
jgi:hypothetical protein